MSMREYQEARASAKKAASLRKKSSRKKSSRKVSAKKQRKHKVSTPSLLMGSLSAIGLHELSKPRFSPMATKKSAKKQQSRRLGTPIRAEIASRRIRTPARFVPVPAE